MCIDYATLNQGKKQGYEIFKPSKFIGNPAITHRNNVVPVQLSSASAERPQQTLKFSASLIALLLPKQKRNSLP